MKLRQIVAVAAYNFRQWRRNPRIVLCFCLAFILCFLLSDKAVRFSRTYGSIMQILEPFIWTFGDANSILLSSLLLILLFADMPFISAGTPFMLLRVDRKTWVLGQALYIVSATTVYLLFVLLSTSIVCQSRSFLGNQWSETAAILGYSGAGKDVALPALVKVLELSLPYACTGWIFVLMLLYTLLLMFLMLLCNLRFGQLGGVIGVLGFSLYGFLLNPKTIQAIFQLPDEWMYKANVAVGWLSPLNQAAYHMHNFGYDLLPRLWQTVAIFLVLTSMLFFLSLRAVRQYNFSFTGTEGGA